MNARPLTARRFGIGAVAALSVALILTACSVTPKSKKNAAPPAGATVSTVVPADKVTLKLAFTTSEDMTNALVKAFETKYPQVTIQPQFTQFSDYVKSLKLTMSSSNAPDLAEYNPALKDLSAAGLIADLTPYEKAYNWDSAFPKSALDELRVDKTGKILGTGSLVGVPGGLSLVGVYYNKQMLAKAGVSAPPTTLEEFGTDLAKAKQAGLTPLSVGALDNGALHLWSAILNVTSDVTQLRSWIDGQPGGTITTDGALQATSAIADYAKKGYFPKSATGTSENDARATFSKGGSVFQVDGNWAASDLDKAMKDNVGFFLVPPAQAGGRSVGNGFSVNFSMSGKTKHPAAAAAFLDFLRSPEASKIATESGFLSPNPAVAPATTGVKQYLTEANKQVGADDGVIPFPDFAAPAMLDSLQAGLQSLIAGRMEPQAFLDSLQKVWTAYHGS